MSQKHGWLTLALWFFMSSAAWSFPSLQHMIDDTPEGGILELKPGTYQGRVIISRPLTIEGHGKATIDGGGEGSVITVQADHVTLSQLNITNSGHSHDLVDAAIVLLSAHNRILKNHIHDTLFGIDMKEAHDNEIIGNEISSKPLPLGERGDAIRAWASNRNIFRENRIHDSRDMIIWYSNDNLVEDNQGWNNRYSLHFMYAGASNVRRNHYRNSAVGIFLMYSRDATLEFNEILYSQGATGMGIGMKEVDNITLRQNRIVYCATGIYIDQSPFDPYKFNLFLGNHIGYNVQGIVFHSTLSRNIFKGNAMIDNLEAVVAHNNGTAKDNLWDGNYWSDYEGFDRNRDGYGDSGYVNHAYLEQLWMDDPWVRFYFASPVISMINFLSKLAPFSEPRLMLQDTHPVFMRDAELRLSPENLQFRIPDEDEMDEIYDN
ncbi:MAG: nitrous oxide reductase family maturation protein NosD [SAR324 cluster bacterium]|nr:nitrous oxide reductase family maturation protein NosD [SAR324 cluster bacterium]